MPSELRTSRLLCFVITAWCCWLAMSSPPTAYGDLVLTTDGKTIPCRLLGENDEGLRVVTGDPAGPREILLTHAALAARLQGAEEIKHIEACDDASKLSAWSAAYYHAGYETLARRALRRALALDRKLGDQPLTVKADASARGPTPAMRYARFRNLAVARDRVASLTDKDAAGLVSAAKWARRAGLTEEAAHYLRLAWRVDPTLGDITTLAEAWGLQLEGWITIDLTPALEGALFFDSIRDEEANVAADPDMEFLCLPLRFDPDRFPDQTSRGAEMPALSRNTFKGKDARGFYGIQPIVIRDGQVRITNNLQVPVYERMLFKAGDGGRLMAEMRNHLGPRVPDPAAGDKRRTGRTARQPRIKTTVTTQRANGWVVAILEVSKSASELKIEWTGGGAEVLDLDFLRQASIVSPDRILETVPEVAEAKRRKNWPWSSAPPVTRALRLAEGPSPAMAALAIERLARIRRQLESRWGPEAKADLKRWSAVVDPQLLVAGGRGEEQVRLATYRYFCDYTEKEAQSPSNLALELLAAAEPDLQLTWVRILSCSLRLEDCSYWWRHAAQRASTDRQDDPPVKAEILASTQGAARLLEAVLGSPDAFVCSEAMDVLLSLPPAVTDWQFLEHASASAQRFALTRLGELNDRASAARLLQALILSARPELAQDVALAAHSLELTAQDIEAAILSQWWSLATTKRRPAFLNVLRGINLGDSVYGKRFARMIEEALKGSEEERNAAWNLQITQLLYRREHIGATRPARQSDTSSTANISHGPFPLMIDPASHDPLLRGIVEAAREGPPELQFAALAALLETGYADEVAQCLLATGVDPVQRDQLFVELIHSSRLAGLDATVALAGHLLSPRCAGLAETIMKYLDHRLAESPPEEQWRLRAAIKAGLHVEEMEALVKRSPAAVAADIRRWLFRLCHMSPQDQQRLASARTPKDRAERLAQINLRRGQIVDGRYGVLAIVVTTTQTKVPITQMQGPSPSAGRWITPRRVTVAMPSIQVTVADTDDDYEVRWQDRVIGQGRIMHDAMPIRGPRAYFPVLRASPVWWSLAGFLAPGIDPETRDEGASGPLRLPSLKVLKKPAPGTMTLDISEFLRAGLADAQVFPDADLAELVPKGFLITLRYGSFGVFSGCGTELFPGHATGDMMGGPEEELLLKRRQLLNVMLVIERMADDE